VFSDAHVPPPPDDIGDRLADVLQRIAHGRARAGATQAKTARTPRHPTLSRLVRGSATALLVGMLTVGRIYSRSARRW
jgi:hypothetical protein